MIRPPPSSTLFPSRRSSDLDPKPAESFSVVGQPSLPEKIRSRSEEHTSELQSRFDLVCRLLLEKKKKNLLLRVSPDRRLQCKSPLFDYQRRSSTSYANRAPK